MTTQLYHNQIRDYCIWYCIKKTWFLVYLAIVDNFASCTVIILLKKQELNIPQFYSQIFFVQFLANLHKNVLFIPLFSKSWTELDVIL